MQSWERHSSPPLPPGVGTAGSGWRSAPGPCAFSRQPKPTLYLTTHNSPLNPHPNQARLTRDELDSLPGHVATRADAARAEVCAICLCEPECGDAHSMLRGPPCWCHSSLPWPPGADCPGSWPRCALGASRCAAQGPKGGRRRCRREDGPKSPMLRLDRCCGLTTPPLPGRLHAGVCAQLPQGLRDAAAPPAGSAALPVPQLATPAAWNTRPRAGPALHFQEERLSRSDPAVAAFGASACPRL